MPHGIGTFTNAVIKASEWVRNLQRIGQFHSEEQAYTVLRAVLHALRDRLLPDEAVQFGAEMPMLIRGFYFEGYDLSHPRPQRANASFFNQIDDEMGKVGFRVSPEHAAQSVLVLLEEKISEGEYSDVVHSLPKKLRKIILAEEIK